MIAQRRVGAALVCAAACASFSFVSPALASAGATTTPLRDSAKPATPVSPSLQLKRLLWASATGEIVKLGCTTGSSWCHATGTLRTMTVLLGTTTAIIPAGKTRTLTIQLDRTGKALLARRGKLVVKLQITLTVDRARSVVATKTLIVRASKPILAVTGAEVVRFAKLFGAVCIRRQWPDDF